MKFNFIKCFKYLFKNNRNRKYLSEIPSETLIRDIKEAEEEIKRGDVSPTFNNTEDAIRWLDDKNRKCINFKKY